MLYSFQQTCLSEVRGPLVDLGVSEYGILSAITTLSDTQNDLGLNRQQSTSPSKPRYSVDDIALFRQIALDLREFRQGNNIFVGLTLTLTLHSVSVCCTMCS